MPTLSIILPVLNEADGIADALAPLQSLRTEGIEVIVVDGGSTDETSERACGQCDILIAAARGRASQMNAGAAGARGEVLLFLHADSHLPEGAPDAVRSAIARGAVWGRFDVRIAGHHPMLKVIAFMMNLRSRLTGIATGDQAIFMTREAFSRVGGFPDQALMEDIALSRTLKARGRPACLRARVTTSARRWETHGVFRTIWLMWRLRAAYALGATPDALARRYETKNAS